MDPDKHQSPQTEGVNEDVETLGELFKEPSSLPEVSANMRGFASEQEAHDVGSMVLGFLRAFGTFLNLERLIAVTVAFDYDQALADVQQGFSSSKKATKTQDDFATGVAMAATVLRDGRPSSHLVINAAVVYPLRGDLDGVGAKLALHVLAHEAAHVHDLAMQDRAFPGLYGSEIADYREGILFGVALQCWDEYIACRLSAEFGNTQDRITHFEDPFCAALETARGRGDSAIIAYRTHAMVETLVSEFQAIYGRVLIYGAYLLGHLDGLEKSMNEAAPKAHNLIQQTNYFRPIFQRFESALQTMKSTYGKWSSLDVFDALKAVVEELLNTAGIRFVKLPSGSYWINVPLT